MRRCIYLRSFSRAPEKIDKCINEGRQGDEQPRYFSKEPHGVENEERIHSMVSQIN